MVKEFGNPPATTTSNDTRLDAFDSTLQTVTGDGDGITVSGSVVVDSNAPDNVTIKTLSDATVNTLLDFRFGGTGTNALRLYKQVSGGIATALYWIGTTDANLGAVFAPWGQVYTSGDIHTAADGRIGHNIPSGGSVQFQTDGISVVGKIQTSNDMAVGNVSGGMYVACSTGAGVRFISGGVERVRVNNAGFTGITDKVSDLGSSGVRFRNVYSENMSSDNGVVAKNVNASFGDPDGLHMRIRASDIALSDGLNPHYIFETGQIRFYPSGVINIGNPFYHPNIVYCNGVSTSSDSRLKDNIIDCNLGLRFINRLKPKSYTLKTDDKVKMGLIAQDVLKILPGTMRGNCSLVNKSDDENGFYSLSYQELIAPLIKAVQELTTTAQELDKEVNKLKKELASLKDQKNKPL